jgi:hypothetical protein
MGRWLESRILWGSVLIIGGVLFLLENLGLIEFAGIFWALIMAAAGVFFLSIYVSNRLNWWALIPGSTLLSLALSFGISELFPEIGDQVGGVLLFGGIGLGFVLVYLVSRANWWAVIPAGVMMTLAIVVILDGIVSDLGVGGIFFLGLGATFALVAMMPTPEGRMFWAWIPSGILSLMGLLILFAVEEMINLLWPIGLIGGGLVLIFLAFRPRR